MNHFRFEVVPARPIEPLGENRFAAKLRFIVEKTDSGEKPVKDPVGECWGRTASEAESKVREAAEAYIKQRDVEDAQPPSP